MIRCYICISNKANIMTCVWTYWKKKCSVEIELLYQKDSCWFQLWTNKPDLQREIRDDSIEYVSILYKKQMRSSSNQELNKYSHCKQNVCAIYIWIFLSTLIRVIWSFNLWHIGISKCNLFTYIKLFQQFLFLPSYTFEVQLLEGIQIK